MKPTPVQLLQSTPRTLWPGILSLAVRTAVLTVLFAALSVCVRVVVACTHQANTTDSHLHAYTCMYVNIYIYIYIYIYLAPPPMIHRSVVRGVVEGEQDLSGMHAISTPSTFYSAYSFRSISFQSSRERTKTRFIQRYIW